MVLSTRISIQWPPSEPKEEANVLAMTTANNNYVDIRIFKSQYPYHLKANENKKQNVTVNDKTKELPFRDVFELCLAGTEVPLSETKIKFVNTINSQALQESIDSGQEVEADEDVGTFSEFGLDRKEIGEMKSPEDGVRKLYVEIWRSLDPWRHTPQNEVRESVEGNTDKDCLAFELVENTMKNKCKGKFVKIGNWAQGIIQLESTIVVTRKWFDGEKWVNLIEYGECELFPNLETDIHDLVVGNVVKTTNNELSWKCIEKS